MKSSEICVFTAICAGDENWVDTYLAEIERLNLPFVIYLDRCNDTMKKIMKEHPNCLYSMEQDDPSIEFAENHKQKIFDKIPKTFRYALALDADEVFEQYAKLTLPEADFLDVTWVNVWEDDKHLRIGDGFGPRSRTKFYNLKREWKWLDPVTNGPVMFIDSQRVDSPPTLIDLVCVHRGLMFKHLRLQHKMRWDRVYITAIGRQPYKLWDLAVDETVVPQIIPNKYL